MFISLSNYLENLILIDGDMIQVPFQIDALSGVFRESKDIEDLLTTYTGFLDLPYLDDLYYLDSTITMKLINSNANITYSHVTKVSSLSLTDFNLEFVSADYGSSMPIFNMDYKFQITISPKLIIKLKFRSDYKYVNIALGIPQDGVLLIQDTTDFTWKYVPYMADQTSENIIRNNVFFNILLPNNRTTQTYYYVYDIPKYNVDMYPSDRIETNVGVPYSQPIRLGVNQAPGVPYINDFVLYGQVVKYMIPNITTNLHRINADALPYDDNTIIDTKIYTSYFSWTPRTPTATWDSALSPGNITKYRTTITFSCYNENDELIGYCVNRNFDFKVN